MELPGQDGPRHYRVEVTPLRDKQGRHLGRLLLLQDVTDQKRAQAGMVEHERVVATLEERERLARELHDSVGQVLGYVSLQTQSIRKWLEDGDGTKADSLLARLAQVAQNAHSDVRESILALRAGSSNDWSFLPTLRRYLDDFGAHHGVHMELLVSEAVTEAAFEPRVGVQLLRVVQEALTNARRHGGATAVRVSVGRQEDRVSLAVVDNGAGFDAVPAREAAAGHFGLAFMAERMAQIGGTMSIDSHPGGGTSVNFEAPMAVAQEGRP
jgi:signal transduction histidine kinase